MKINHSRSVQAITTIILGGACFVCGTSTQVLGGGREAGPCIPMWSNAPGIPGMSGGYVSKLHVHDEGLDGGPKLYAIGNFPSAGGAAGTSLLARWSGTAWESVGGGLLDQFGNAMETFNSNLIVGGYFNSANGVPGTAKLAQWNGTSWSTMNGVLDEFDDSVWALKAFDDGSGDALYVGGNYFGIGGTTIDYIARYDGTNYTAVGGTIAGTNIPLIVMALQVWDDGGGPALYMGGRFLTVAGVSASRIAKWDGKEWSGLGTGITGTSSGTAVYAMEPWNDGSGPSLFVAGQAFTGAGGVPVNRIARWDGTNWHDVGGGANGTIWDVKVFDDGSGEALYAVGLFTSIGGVACNRVAKWDGKEWSAVGTGVGADNSVFAAMPHNDGSGPALFIGGSFLNVETLNSNRIARYNGCEPLPCRPGDVNCDDVVNANDLLAVINAWGPCAQPCPPTCAADVTNDCTVNANDLLMVINNWG